jgi:hypothetical protein
MVSLIPHELAASLTLLNTLYGPVSMCKWLCIHTQVGMYSCTYEQLTMYAWPCIHLHIVMYPHAHDYLKFA